MISAEITYRKYISQIYGTGSYAIVYPALALIGYTMG